jgi:hypothetical protein
MNYVVLVCFLLLPSFASEAQTSGASEADKTEIDTQSCTDCVTSLSQEKHEAERVVPNSGPPDAPSSTSLAKQDTFAWSLAGPTKQADTAPKPAPIWDKPMWAATIFQAGATIFDIEMTHEGIAHHKCVEGNLSLARHPSRSELYLDNLEEFAPAVVIDGLGLLGLRAAHLPRWYWRTVGYFSPVYGSTIHLRGGIHWYTRCW